MVEYGPAWARWSRDCGAEDLEAIAERTRQLVSGFGRPHIHAGLGVRRLSTRVFEFRISRDLRVVFLLVKPRTLRVQMCGNHDQVRTWLKENG